MINFDSLEKGRFSCHILLIKQTSLSDCLYFLRYWTIFYWAFFIFHHFSFFFKGCQSPEIVSEIYFHPIEIYSEKLRRKTPISCLVAAYDFF